MLKVSWYSLSAGVYRLQDISGGGTSTVKKRAYRISAMRHSITVLPCFDWLHAVQAGRMIPAECRPPRLSGITCSFPEGADHVRRCQDSRRSRRSSG